MIDTLKPLLLSHNYDADERNSMIDKTKLPIEITKWQYKKLFIDCVKLNTDFVIDYDNVIYILANFHSKAFKLIPLSDKYYEYIMKRATKN